MIAEFLMGAALAIWCLLNTIAVFKLESENATLKHELEKFLAGHTNIMVPPVEKPGLP